MGAVGQLKVQSSSRANLLAFACILLFLLCRGARADVTVLVGEPYGSFGTMMPVGHAAIYLDRVCADGPLKLRMCQPGEQAGVVIARYHQLGAYDWMATPVMEFLYAVQRPESVLDFATAPQVNALLESYRQRFLESVVPDGEQKRKGTDEWLETAGAAYTRKLWGYTLSSTPMQDEQAVAQMNAAPNHHRYHLAMTNCANFAADVLNLYYPGIVKHSDVIADFGWMTPKQVVRSVANYGAHHPEAQARVFEIPQVPGTLRRSRPIRGAAEGELKTKRYLFTLMVIQPEIPAITALMYLDHGRWQVGRGATLAVPGDFLHHEPGAMVASEKVQTRRGPASGTVLTRGAAEPVAGLAGSQEIDQALGQVAPWDERE